MTLAPDQACNLKGNNIIGDNAPANITFFDSTGNQIDGISVLRYSQVLITFSCSGSGVSWSISHSLSDGLIMDSRNQKISGRAITVSSKQSYIVVAKNWAGNSSAIITIEVTDCKYGEFLFSNMKKYDKASLVLKDGSTTVFEQYNFLGYNHGIAICVPIKDYDFYYKCEVASVACVLQLESESGMVYFEKSIKRNMSINGTMQMIAQQLPHLEMKPEIVIYSGQSIKIDILVSGIFSRISFIPALPDSLSLDVLSHVLSGTVLQNGVTTYIVSTSNNVGKREVPLTIFVGTCSAKRIIYTISRTSVSSSDGYTVISPSGEVVYNETLPYGAYKKIICLSEGEYNLVLSTTEVAGGWYKGSTLFIRDKQDDIIGLVTLSAGKREERFPLWVVSCMNEQKTMMIKKDAITAPKRWNNIKGKTKDWTLGNAQSWGNFVKDINTVYFRNTFSIASPSSMTSLQVDLYSKDSVTVYLNGHYLFIDNILSGEPAWHRTTVTATHLVAGNNLLAVALLRSKDTESTAPIIFDMNAMALSITCTLRSTRGIATDSIINGTAAHPPAYAFDGMSDTYWESTVFPVFLQYEFVDGGMNTVNKIGMMTGMRNEAKLPNKMEFLGMNDDDHGDVLFSADSKTLFKESHSETFFYLNNDRAYRKYRLVIHSINSGASVQIPGLNLYLCTAAQCKKSHGWRAAKVDEEVYGRCSITRVGISRMICQRNGDRVEWEDKSHCLSRIPAVVDAFVDMTYVIRNCKVETFNPVVAKSLESLFNRDIMVQSREITFVNIRDASDSIQYATEVIVRLTVEREIGDYVLKHLILFNKNVTTQLQQTTGMNDLSVDVMVKPTLRLSLTPQGVIAVVCVCVVVAIIVGFHALLILRRKSTGNKKSLNRKETKKSLSNTDRESLLS